MFEEIQVNENSKVKLQVNEANHEIKTKRYTFSFVSDIDVKNPFFFNVEPKFFINIF